MGAHAEELAPNLVGEDPNDIARLYTQLLWAGQPDLSIDIQRVAAVRELLGDGFPLMVDANPQRDRQKATRACRALEEFDLTWSEEPLDAHGFEGHGQLAERLDTAIATGEMLTCFDEPMHLKAGRMHVSDRPGLGFSLSDQARRWTIETQEFGRRPWHPVPATRP